MISYFFFSFFLAEIDLVLKTDGGSRYPTATRGEEEREGRGRACIRREQRENSPASRLRTFIQCCFSKLPLSSVIIILNTNNNNIVIIIIFINFDYYYPHLILLIILIIIIIILLSIIIIII